MPVLKRKAPHQPNRYSSSWTLREAIALRAWNLVWLLFFRPTPKIFNCWRLFLLRSFGAKVTGHPFVFPTAKIYAPFLLSLDDRACLGPYSEVYNLGPVHLMEKATVSQHAYICNGTHDFDDPAHPLLIGDITVGKDTFIGALAFVMPGVTIGDGSIVGACAVVTRDVPPGQIVAGNPAKLIRTRNRVSLE
jgi:putative colanic acid biosynthesis acetyltransferase WcaF